MITENDLPQPGDFLEFHPFIKGVFSQWHPAGFDLDGHRFVTAEQWMMFAKAELFGDRALAAAILLAPTPSEQKRLGQMVGNFDQPVWDMHKLDIVYRGNHEKFRQNAGALRQLAATGPLMLVEANVRDWIWGAGVGLDDTAAHSPDMWRGTNFLGRILTLVKQQLLTSSG